MLIVCPVLSTQRTSVAIFLSFLFLLLTLFNALVCRSICLVCVTRKVKLLRYCIRIKFFYFPSFALSSLWHCLLARGEISVLKIFSILRQLCSLSVNYNIIDYYNSMSYLFEKWHFEKKLLGLNGHGYLVLLLMTKKWRWRFRIHLCC